MKPFENIEGKGENAGNQHFLLFPQCFLPYQKLFKLSFELYLFCPLQMLSIWSSLKFFRFVKSWLVGCIVGLTPPVLTQLFFPKPPTTFLTCFCRGDRRKYAGKKSRLNRRSNSQPSGHESDTLTTEPPGRGLGKKLNAK